jgi:hypothetical protein
MLKTFSFLAHIVGRKAPPLVLFGQIRAGRAALWDNEVLWARISPVGPVPTGQPIPSLACESSRKLAKINASETSPRRNHGSG